MLKVMNSVSRKSLAWHHYKSEGHPCSLACLIMICSLLDVTHKEHNWRNGLFRCLEKWPQSVLRCWIYRQCAAEFSAGKQQRLIVHYGLEWSPSVIVLTGDVDSAMKWRQLRGKPPSPQAFITSSPLCKWRIWFHSLPRRGMLVWHLHHQGMKFRHLFC